MFSTLHELIALIEVVEPEVVFPVGVELDTLEEVTELVPIVDVVVSIELVTLMELRASMALVAPAA